MAGSDIAYLLSDVVAGKNTSPPHAYDDATLMSQEKGQLTSPIYIN